MPTVRRSNQDEFEGKDPKPETPKKGVIFRKASPESKWVQKWEAAKDKVRAKADEITRKAAMRSDSQPLRPMVRSLRPPPDRREAPRGKTSLPVSTSPQQGRGTVPDQDTVMCGKECPACKKRSEPKNKMGRCNTRLRSVGGRAVSHKGNCSYSCDCALRDAAATSRRAGEILREMLPSRQDTPQPGRPNDRDRNRNKR